MTFGRMRLRREALLFAAALIAGSASAARISVADAACAARSFAEEGRHLVRGIGTVPRTIREHTAVDGSAFFSVRMVGGGTIFLSCDDQYEPIIAFSAADIDFENLDRQSPLFALLNGDARARRVTSEANVRWQRLLSQADASRVYPSLLSAVMLASSLSEPGDVRVPALLTTQWNQDSAGGGYCFNYYTPNHAVCGCVATAMSQVMRYHRWPDADHPVGQGTYKCAYNGVVTNLTMQGGAYVWDSMPAGTSGDPITSTEHRQSIGKLTSDAGISVNMSYTSSGSGAYTAYVPDALMDIWHYGQATFLYDCSDYGYGYIDGNYGAKARIEALQKTLFSNFDCGYPVILGIDNGGDGGHCIVADGYGYEDGVDYVHLNMGWSGAYDLWYNLPSIGTGYNYNSVAEAVYNVFPTNDTSYAAFSGRVVDSTTNGVASARVTIYRSGTSEIAAEVFASQSGVYGAALPGGKNYDVVAVSADFSKTGTLSQVALDVPNVSCESYCQRVVFAGGAIGNSWGNDVVLGTAVERRLAPTNFYVSASVGADAPDRGTLAAPYATIQYAITNGQPLVAGDVVNVFPGTYFGCVESPLEKISIVSLEGPDVTTLDGEGNDCCYFGYANPETLLAGFTLRNGACQNGGGALYGTLSNCVITACVANYGGGACQATLIDCLVLGNAAYASGRSYGYGGGASGSTLLRCTVLGNGASYVGSGVDCECVCSNSIVWANYNGSGKLDNWEAYVVWYGECYTPLMNWCCTTPSGYAGGTGCIDADPLLAAPARADVRLMTDSPCVGTASDGQNMGCWQGVPLTNAIYSVGPSECDFETLQEALNVAVRGDSVRVQPATYRGVTNYAENISIVSLEGAARTVLDGAGRQRCFDDYGAATLVGFTLVNGAADRVYGGGAYGGTLVGCVISNCSACSGGGVAWSVLTNCLVVGNRATGTPEDASVTNGFGGGACNARLFNCTLAGNSAYDFGGGALLDSGYDAVNTIVSGNICDKGYDNGNDVYGMGYYEMVCSLSDQDAKFVDAARGDYRLSARSPCIDVGTNAFVSIASDLDGTNRIVGARVDMGCYEYAHQPAGWPVPAVPVSATPAEESVAVSAAMTNAGFSSEQAMAVTTLKQYNELSAWAEEKAVGVSAAAASPTTLISAALDASALLTLTTDDLKLTELTPASDGQWTMKLSLKAYDEAKASPELLKAAVGVVGSETPSGSYTKDNLALSVSPAAGAIEIKVTPPSDKSAYFLKSTVR